MHIVVRVHILTQCSHCAIDVATGQGSLGIARARRNGPDAEISKANIDEALAVRAQAARPTIA